MFRKKIRGGKRYERSLNTERVAKHEITKEQNGLMPITCPRMKDISNAILINNSHISYSSVIIYRSIYIISRLCRYTGIKFFLVLKQYICFIFSVIIV